MDVSASGVNRAKYVALVISVWVTGYDWMAVSVIKKKKSLTNRNPAERGQPWTVKYEKILDAFSKPACKVPIFDSCCVFRRN